MSEDTKLTAGREMDAIIAEKVMGQERIADCPLGDPDCPGKFTPQVGAVPCLPRYSSEIAAAWLVVERFAEYELAHSPHPEGGHIFRIYHPDGSYLWERGTTAPEAICKAALKALG
jgi:hypothetical protein